MNRSILNLLRRTIAIAGAVAGLALSNSSLAQQTVTLVGASSNTCSFSGALTVAPNGALSIQCSGVVTPPTGALFSLSAPAQLNINTPGNSQTTVTRSGGAGLGTLSVNYSVTGAGCVGASGALSFPEGVSTPQPISITTAGAAGTCVVAITPPAGSTASPSTATISIVDPGVGQIPGCPVPDPNAIVATVTMATWLGQTQPSGVIGYTTVPAPTLAGRASVRYEQTIGTTTASAMRTEISVSRCPGVIDSSVPQCYINTDYTIDNRLDVYTKPVFSWNSQATLGNRGCWAPASAGTWYVNYRWTYSGCQYGSCGFVLQWFNGPY